jgi:hypothetical protein
MWGKNVTLPLCALLQVQSEISKCKLLKIHPHLSLCFQKDSVLFTSVRRAVTICVPFPPTMSIVSVN